MISTDVPMFYWKFIFHVLGQCSSFINCEIYKRFAPSPVALSFKEVICWGLELWNNIWQTEVILDHGQVFGEIRAKSSVKYVDIFSSGLNKIQNSIIAIVSFNIFLVDNIVIASD